MTPETTARERAPRVRAIASSDGTSAPQKKGTVPLLLEGDAGGSDELGGGGMVGVEELFGGSARGDPAFVEEVEDFTFEDHAERSPEVAAVEGGDRRLAPHCDMSSDDRLTVGSCPKHSCIVVAIRK